tara:strand:- start:203 stop:721 length:519 start_codon:yes stop_codon:yes gene_type:complete
MKDIIIIFFILLIFYYILKIVINCLTKELRNKQLKLLNNDKLIEGLDVEMATNVDARTQAIQASNYQNLALYKAQRAEKEVGDAGASFMISVIITIILLCIAGFGGWYLYEDFKDKKNQASIPIPIKQNLIPKDTTIKKPKTELIPNVEELSDRGKLVKKISEKISEKITQK